MNFVGRKVIIRAIEREDLAVLAAYHNDPVIAATIEFSWPISLRDQEKFFERLSADASTRRFVIELPSIGVIGYTGLWGIDWIDRRATNGVIIGRADSRGKGYGLDAVVTLARIAFEQIGLRRLDAEIYAFNSASLRLYTACGWQEEGRRREHVFRDGEYHDRVLMGLTKRDYSDWSRRTNYWRGTPLISENKS